LLEWFDSRPERFEGVRDEFRLRRGFGGRGHRNLDLREFDFRFRRDIEGLFPNVDPLQERTDQFNE